MADMDPFVLHFNARVHGMKRELFSAAEIDAFLEQGDLNRFVDALLDSDYRTEMAEALTRYQGADAVEEAGFARLEMGGQLAKVAAVAGYIQGG